MADLCKCNPVDLGIKTVILLFITGLLLHIFLYQRDKRKKDQREKKEKF